MSVEPWFFVSSKCRFLIYKAWGWLGCHLNGKVLYNWNVEHCRNLKYCSQCRKTIVLSLSFYRFILTTYYVLYLQQSRVYDPKYFQKSERSSPTQSPKTERKGPVAIIKVKPEKKFELRPPGNSYAERLAIKQAAEHEDYYQIWHKEFQSEVKRKVRADPETPVSIYIQNLWLIFDDLLFRIVIFYFW